MTQAPSIQIEVGKTYLTNQGMRVKILSQVTNRGINHGLYVGQYLDDYDNLKSHWDTQGHQPGLYNYNDLVKEVA